MDGFEKGVYHLRMHGPNGFLREVAGSAGNPALEIHCGYETGAGKPTGNMELRFSAAQSARLVIRDNADGAKPRAVVLDAGARQTVVLPLVRTRRWYDCSVTVEGSPEYLRRFAGRVETGEPGISDPCLGRQSVSRLNPLPEAPPSFWGGASYELLGCSAGGLPA